MAKVMKACQKIEHYLSASNLVRGYTEMNSSNRSKPCCAEEIAKWKKKITEACICQTNRRGLHPSMAHGPGNNRPGYNRPGYNRPRARATE